MEEYTVETIITRKDFGTRRYFKTYKQAQKFAIKQSLKKGVIETFLLFEDYPAEIMEYYSGGKLDSKVA